jgi:DNA-binding transcriptional LysR family regulator
MLEAMLLFLRVVQSGGMSAAGKEVNLSPASVSRTIAMLEERLGVQLFNRTSRKIVLTEAGETYYARVKPLLDELQQIESFTRDKQDEPKGQLRVHAHTSVGIHLVTPRMLAFRQRYPEISVDLQLSETPVNLLEQNFDVDIRLGELQDSSMLMRRLAPSDRVLVASPQYLASHPPISQPSDLLQHNCVTYRPNAETTTWRLARDGEEMIELKVGGSLHTNNSEVLRRAAVSGIGIAMLTNWISEADRRAGRLVEVLPDYRATINSFNNGIFAVFRQTRFVPRKVRVFVDFLASNGMVEPVFETGIAD